MMFSKIKTFWTQLFILTIQISSQASGNTEINITLHEEVDLENLPPVSQSSFLDLPTKKLAREMYEEGYRITNTLLCPDLGKNMKLIIFVTSALLNNESRMAVRQTWSFHGRRHDVSVGFIIGSSADKQPSENANIQMEQQAYGDIIQTHTVDSYDNLTLQTISMLKWVDSYCPQVPFVLKTDDHVFINIPLLLQVLEKNQQAKRSIFGRLAHAWKPERNVDQPSKYYVNKAEYESDIFPDFLIGPSYLMTQDSVYDLYHQARRMLFLRLEDVFLTGLVAKSVEIQLNDMIEFRDLDVNFNKTEMRSVIGINYISPKAQFLSWANMMTDESSQAG